MPIQIKYLKLNACVRITYDAKDNELSLGFVTDKNGEGPQIEWDLEAKMGRLDLPDFLEDYLPSRLVSLSALNGYSALRARRATTHIALTRIAHARQVGYLLKKYTPASPLKVPVDLSDMISDAILEGRLDLDDPQCKLEKMEEELEGLQEELQEGLEREKALLAAIARRKAGAGRATASGRGAMKRGQSKKRLS